MADAHSTLNEEIWKDIPSWHGIYQASSHGNIRSVVRKVTQANSKFKAGIQERTVGGKVLSPKTGRGGYMYVNLWVNNKAKMCAVHRLVCEAFTGETNGLDVNHKNGIKSDNSASNLEWLTRRENLNHAFRELGITPVWELNRRRAASRRGSL